MKQRQPQDGRTLCGYCMTGHHQNCRPEIKYYDKVWYCYCKECNSMVVSEEETEEESNEQGTSDTGTSESSGDAS